VGIEHAKADLIVMASAHVYPVYPDWLENTNDTIQRKRCGVTYGKQRGSESTHFSELQIFQHWYPEHSSPSTSFSILQ